MKVIIEAAGWRYRSKSTGRLVPVERGAEVELDDVLEGAELDKARRHGVFREEGSASARDALATEASGAPFGQGVGPLAEWLKANPLNVDKTVRLAGNDPERARMLIDAEPVATSGKPRRGVLVALGKVITTAEENSAGSDETTPEENGADADTGDGAGDGGEEDADGDEGTAPEADGEDDPDAAGTGDDDDPEG